VDALRPAIRRRVPVCCRCHHLLYRVVEKQASLLHPAIYLHAPGPDRVWTTAQVSNAAGTLAISLVLAGVRHWTCQHALTVANKVAVDVQACGFNQTEPAAVAIAGQIAAKLADR